MRIALGVEYDGARFNGWQRQSDGRSVQAGVEAALSKIANAPVTVQCAGRTDAGVHARAQVVHFDSPAERPERAWVLGANSLLPPDVAIQWARPVSQDFHARFSALARSYRYVICNRVARPGLWAGKVSFVHGELDAAMMHAAAQCLVGRHDFSSFRAAGCQARHAVRDVSEIAVERTGEYVVMTITANAFLQHMVRNIIGTLLPVGHGTVPADRVSGILAARDRKAAGITASPDGLYLEAVRYPADVELPPPPKALFPWQLA